jgi:hypothetical protein
MNEGPPIPVNTSECTMLPALIPGFTAKQMGRLATFEHMVRLVRETMIRNRTEDPQFYGYVVDGKMVSPYFRLDSHFVSTVNKTSESMYADELAKNPVTQQAAQDIIEKVRLDLEGHTMTPGECVDLFNKP